MECTMVIKINVLGLYLLIFRDADSILLYKKVHMIKNDSGRLYIKL